MAVLAAFGGAGAWPASGQTNYGALPSDRQKEFVAVGKACRTEAARLCPAVAPGQFHNVAICLRPYRTSLSLGCRASLRGLGATAAGRTDSGNAE